MTNKFQLPGAENFSEYLEEKLEGILTVEGPEVVDWSYGVDYTKKWIISLNGEQIGVYRTFGPKPGEAEFGREFKGRIPGYVNECLSIYSKYKLSLFKNCKQMSRLTEDTVSLIYSNTRFEFRSFNEEPESLINTPWQRQDGHKKIPFP